MTARERNWSWQRFLDDTHIFDPEDRISRLPEDVIRHITSLLPSEDKDKLPLLSRKWWLTNSQSQKTFILSRCRLDEEHLSTIFQHYFPSIEAFELEKCSGITNLNVVSSKLRHVILTKCASLNKVKLTAPALDFFEFSGSIRRPSIVELGATANLKILRLFGVQIDETTFSKCDTTFPVLAHLTLGGSYYMPDCINISSRSLKAVHFFDLKKPVDITMDAPELFFVLFRGDPVANFSNTNIPSVGRATIEMAPCADHELNVFWFKKLVHMIQAFHPTYMLLLKSTLDKHLIIPEEFRGSLTLPVIGPERLMVEMENPPTNIAGIVDTMLWISPRAMYIAMLWENKFRCVWLTHGEIMGVEDRSCCTSYPTRCWRHTLVEYNCGLENDLWSDLSSYFKENLKNVARHAI